MTKFRIGLGVTGGIAAYKAVEVMRLLQKAGCEVSVAMTKHATEFVQPLTFRALTEKYVIVDDYDPENPDPIAHVNFSQNIDLLLIVPATANIIGKFANGVADDFLSSTYLASNAPVLIAPAMNTTMWGNPATQRNVAQLKADGVRFVEPIEGELACKTIGTGKLEDVDNIVVQALMVLEGVKSRRAEGEKGRAGDGESDRYSALHNPHSALETPHSALRTPHSQDLAGERILITVGGTREAIDPVRFISNRSSGKMGFAVAEAAVDRGAEVAVVVGVTTVEAPKNVKLVYAESASEMYEAVMSELPSASVFIGAAAVADYAPSNIAKSKIKKAGQDSMTLELSKTPDILSEVSNKRRDGMIVVGFAAETTDVVKYGRSKLENKSLDLVVANDITKQGAGFDTDTNIATILTRNGNEIELPLMSKREMADKILDEIVRLRQS
jgi:phosphopantothenoylcysteine decarboxylase / phosphopantothenate---cysteine ligase